MCIEVGMRRLTILTGSAVYRISAGPGLRDLEVEGRAVQRRIAPELEGIKRMMSP